MNRVALMSGVCFAVLAVSHQAEARQAQADSQEATTVDEIVVTAQRRSERLIDVPISISTRSGEELETLGITTINDLSAVTPGLKIDQTGAGFTVPALRGISTGITGAGEDPNVAIYIDGIYQPNSIANNFNFADLERVEVAKGPQGTLFGRNATGGAISIFTQRPSFTPKGNIETSYGRFNDLTVKGFVSGPIVQDKLAGSIAGFYQKNDDYYRNLVTGGYGDGLEETVLRGKLLWTPTANASFLLTAAHLDRSAANGSNGQPYLGNSATRNTPGAIIPTEPWQIALDGEPGVDVESTSVSLKSEIELDAGLLTSLTSYQDIRYRVIADSDYVHDGLVPPLFKSDLSSPQKTFTQELTFASREYGSFSYLAGLFYYQSESGWDPAVTNDSVFVLLDKKATAWAAFGEATWALTDRLKVVGGLRYSSEEIKGSQVIGIGALPPTLPPAGGGSWDSVTPRLSVSFALSDRVNLYGTYSEGFKSGGLAFLTATPGVIDGVYTIPFTSQTYEPEKVKAYEIGVKGRYFDVLHLNVAAFYYEYTDQQVSTYIQQGGAQLLTVANAASSTIKGIDVDGSWRVTDAFTLSGGLSLLDAKFDDFLAQVLLPVLVAGQPSGNVAAPKDVSGNRMIRSPEWTLNLAANYRLKFAAGDLDLNASLYHSDTVFYDVDNRVRQDPYTTYNASVFWRPAGTNWSLSVWGRNLSDEPVISGVYQHEGGDGVNYALPRTYGVSLGYSF